MFGHSWKIKKGTQYGAEKLCGYLGIGAKTSKQIGKGIGIAVGLGVALKTVDLLGAQVIFYEEIVEQSINEVMDQSVDEVINCTVSETESSISDNFSPGNGTNQLTFGGDIPDNPSAAKIGRGPHSYL